MSHQLADMAAPVGLGRGTKDHPVFPLTHRLEGIQLQKEKRKKEGNAHTLYKIWGISLTFWFPTGTDHMRLTHEANMKACKYLGNILPLDVSCVKQHGLKGQWVWMKCSIFGFKLPHKALYVHLLSTKWCLRNQRILSGMLSAIFSTECQAATGRRVTACETVSRALPGTPWKARLLADLSGAAAPVPITSDGVWVTMRPRPHHWESLLHSSNFIS